ncbi:MAG: hypothetical protein J1F39_02900 [Clostridiales bacterium]|nr:hypothetical protein [Clostridiales bacterium]
MNTEDILLEPLSAYEAHYGKTFSDNATEHFDGLVARSGISVEENRATVREYNTERAHVSATESSISSKKALRVFLIVVCVVCFVAAAVGIAALVTKNTIAGIIMLAAGIPVGAGMILIIKLVIAPKISALGKILDERRQKADKILSRAWEQMRPLNDLFESNTTKMLIEKTVPIIKVDDIFSMRRYDYLRGKYGFGEKTDPRRSTTALVSGEIIGNPFVIERELVQTIINKTYTGSIVIHWTETHTDSDGHTHTVSHSQTLTASVTKPAPDYNEYTRLIYGNDAAPDLVFSHEPTHAERWSEKELERKVNSGLKDIRKQQKKALEKGGATFTEMGNAEFDVLFNAFDRNNEVQFRLLFTPLAQKNMLALMKDKNHFGDDFYFDKRGCLNYIMSEHAARCDLDADYRRYYSYDVDEAQKKFMDFNTSFFKNIYFDFAPLLSIPLYQQHKPQEYKYRDNYERNYTSYETECAVNRLGEKAFAPDDSATRSILKTSFMFKDGQSDAVEVTAYAFRSERRVDYISTLGGDGFFHDVPVYWDEYIPVERRSTVKIKGLGIEDSEFARASAVGGPLENIMASLPVRAYGKGLLCCLTEPDAPFDSLFSGLNLTEKTQ